MVHFQAGTSDEELRWGVYLLEVRQGITMLRLRHLSGVRYTIPSHGWSPAFDYYRSCPSAYSWKGPPEQFPQGHIPVPRPYLVPWKGLCLKAILLKVPVTAAHCVHLGSVLTQLLITWDKAKALETNWTCYSIPPQNHHLCSCGIWLLLLLANLVAALLKEYNKTRKGKEYACLRSEMPKQIGAVESRTDSEGLLIHWVSNLYAFSPSGFPQIFLFPHFNCSSILSHNIKLHSPVLCGYKLPPFVLRSTVLWHWARPLSFESTLGSFLFLLFPFPEILPYEFLRFTNSFLY